MPELTELKLYWNDFGDAGAQALLDSPHFSKLRTIDLRCHFMHRLSAPIKRRWRARLGSGAIM
jgi:hypothetical protein